MSEKMHRLFLYIGLWATIFAACCLCWHKITGFLSIFSSFFYGGLVLTGCVLAIFCLVRLFKEDEKLPPLIALALVSGLIAFFLTETSMRWGRLIYFHAEKKMKYDALVTRVFSTQDFAKRKEICAGICEVDETSPDVLAFEWAENNVATGRQLVIYDRAGIIAKMGEGAYPRMLGRAVHKIEPLTGNWYLCHLSYS
ncbi:MAG TPA: hypothetical protein VFD58_05510 [Blastocatellia bacterium]|nr:hypothetical protein [Blastocatellia bacterium]